MSIYPWNQVGTNGSPFVLTFQHMGITIAAGILNFVVITASVSAINSDVFGVGRMLNGMAEQGHAPKAFTAISKRGVPWVTVLVMMCAMLIAVYLNYIMPECFLGYCVISDVCYCLGLDHDPILSDCFPPFTE